MKVVLSDAAEADLEAIGDWIAKDSPLRAISYVGGLRTACERLGAMPNAYSLVPGHNDIRRRVHDNYLIVYTVGKQVEVLHILHGARNYHPLLFPPDAD